MCVYRHKIKIYIVLYLIKHIYIYIIMFVYKKQENVMQYNIIDILLYYNKISIK